MWQPLCVIVYVLGVVHGRYQVVDINQDWWETAVFYQIYVRSFMDSDGDGIGDLNGVTTRLDYLRELGVNAAILAPIFKSPMHDFGYDTSDFYQIHNEYGSMEDFEHLLQKADSLNIKIVLDMIPNHTSNESEWFVKSLNGDEYYNDWYIWEKGFLDQIGRKPPNNWLSVFKKSAWSYNQGRDQFYLHQFGTSQPDLNYRNPVVVDEMKAIFKFWLEKGVAGIRIHAVNHLFEADKDLFGGHFPNEPKTGRIGIGFEDYNYLQHVFTKDQEETYDMVSQWRDVFDAITIRDNLTRVMITEAATSIKNAVRYYGEGIHNGVHIPVNFILADFSKELDARDIKFAVDKWLTYKPANKHANWMTGNHDRSRIATKFRAEMVDAFNMLNLLLPGIAITYMGEELGMYNGGVSWSESKDPLACNTDDPVNYVHFSRDPYRTPFQWNDGRNAGFSTADRTWLPVADTFEKINVANQKSMIRSHYQVYRSLTALRLRPAFKIGRYESLALNSDVFAFKRWYADDTYMIVINFGKSFHVLNLTVFDLVFGQLEVELSSALSSRTYSDNVNAASLELSADEALVLRMQV